MIALVGKGKQTVMTAKDESPFCFKCKFFYKEKGKKYASAHCLFDLYNTCAGRLYGADMGEEYKGLGEANGQE